jgi:hypothetical protein
VFKHQINLPLFLALIITQFFKNAKIKLSKRKIFQAQRLVVVDILLFFYYIIILLFYYCLLCLLCFSLPSLCGRCAAALLFKLFKTVINALFYRLYFCSKLCPVLAGFKIFFCRIMIYRILVHKITPLNFIAKKSFHI